MDDGEIDSLAREVGKALKRCGLTLATAESCTGGWVSTAITSVAGSSEWFDRGFVAYSNDAKRELLGVAEASLRDHGAVSERVAGEMAEGALAKSAAGVSVAVTGIAGPGGGTAEKPVGTVCLAWAMRGESADAETRRFAGDRGAVRCQSVVAALDGLLKKLLAVPAGDRHNRTSVR